MIRFYIMPAPRIGNARAPKYFKSRRNPDGMQAKKWTAMYYGQHPVCIVRADVTGAQHTELTAHTDCVSPPADLSKQIAGGLNTVKNVLEAMDIPADWVQPGMTYGSVLRKVASLFQFAQRYAGLHKEPLVSGELPLDLLWGNIAAAKQQKIIETAQSLGYPVQAPPAGWTVRRILKYLADQWGDRPLHLGARNVF